VVFVAHQASRTGSPAVLLTFLRWVRDHQDLDFEVLVWRGGPLVEDFAEVGPTTVVQAAGTRSLGRVVDTPSLPSLVRRTGRTARAVRLRRRLGGLADARLLYLNSAESGQLLRFVDPPGAGVISHVHELDRALRTSMPEPDHRRHWLDRTNRFVAVADCVAENLTRNHGIDPSRVERHYEFVDVARMSGPSPDASGALRDRLGLPPDARIVGASGTREWRKGFDLFLQLARSLGHRLGEGMVHLVWLGGDDTGPEAARLTADLAQLDMANVHAVDTVDDPRDWFAAFDVFVLTSREDPFPLVCLEAGLLGRPVVAFDCGGMTELLDGTNGLIVPPLDVEAMAEAVAGLLRSSERRRDLGARLDRDVRARHDVSVAAPALADLVQRELHAAGSRR
jgi:glycosyltransferase involved in cell wall biosynthesis